eukprot:Plantae.Rhodophyta-Rhodochaete_pulchella.ctg4647.p1 GENE.Plantae.Rhodophyta-Rhodochaete_pulchella.ctg4647~~Plantae.Rhodophyta-Rhodochaete_pulchella.ctg4647.p1  ORF type:complete len:481 (+),score=70.35 Plantae.Rhodophyta-Rhodochaete_pulchella.ctg4647:3-1445(+)
MEDHGKGRFVPAKELEQMLTPNRKLERFTLEEVAKHDKPDDLWIIVDRHVYNITPFRLLHPGGRLPLENMAGKDATDPFLNYHPAPVYKMLRRYAVGILDDGGSSLEKASPLMADFRKLREKLISEGWFETSYVFYLKQLAWLAFLFSTAIFLTLKPATWVKMVGAVFMAAFWQQLAFPGHDTGHSAITHDGKIDHIIGITVGNLLGGVSIGWWKWSHNVHHIVCNSVEHDPDIQHLPFFAVTWRIFKKFWSSFHSKWMHLGSTTHFFVAHQHILYYPVMAVARFNLYAQSIILLLSKEVMPFKNLEIGALVGFWIWMIRLLATFDSVGQAVAWLLISHAFAGILHVQITLSHFSMETYHGYKGHSHHDDEDSWFRMQCATSMDVESGFWTEWFHGGLQYQVEHHLFPRLPRHKLRAVRPFILELCKKHNVKFHIMSFYEGNLHVLAALRKAAAQVKSLKPGQSIEDVPDLIWESMNARG